jgi:hypothetical protein
MSEMVYDTDDSDSTFASHNHVESDIKIFEEAKQQEDETKDEDSSDDDRWTYPKNETYQPYIVLFMSFTHSRTYPATAEFTKEHQLLSIKPHHVKRWLNERAYHTPTHTEQDRPIYQHAGSLKKAKQALSFYYHPNKHVLWLEGTGGNPTIHLTLNALI